MKKETEEKMEKPIKGKGKESKEIKVYGLNKDVLVVPIKGTSSLICHKWSELNKQKILDKQSKGGATVKGRETRKPEEEFKASLYEMADGRYGFPSGGFRKAIIQAAGYTNKAFTKTLMRGVVFIKGDFVPIKSKTGPKMRTDIIRVSNGAPDFRYRAEFGDWEADLEIIYNSNVISKEQLVNMIQLAGFSVGVGDWRPECNGNHGMFEVKTR